METTRISPVGDNKKRAVRVAVQPRPPLCDVVQLPWFPCKSAPGLLGAERALLACPQVVAVGAVQGCFVAEFMSFPNR